MLQYRRRTAITFTPKGIYGAIRVKSKTSYMAFDDNSLIGKSYLTLEGERYEVFQDFYSSIN